MRKKLLVVCAAVALLAGATFVIAQQVQQAQDKPAAAADPRIDKLLQQNEQILKNQEQILKALDGLKQDLVQVRRRGS